MVLRLNKIHKPYNNVSWRPKSLTLVLWLTRMFILPFWELHPLEPLRPFPSTTDVFCLDQLMKPVTTSILCMYYKTNKQEIEAECYKIWMWLCSHLSPFMATLISPLHLISVTHFSEHKF